MIAGEADPCAVPQSGDSSGDALEGPGAQRGTKRGAEPDKNINTATLEQLGAVRGISQQLARNLLAMRPFRSRKDAIKRTTQFGEGKMKNLEAEGFFVGEIDAAPAASSGARAAKRQRAKPKEVKAKPAAGEGMRSVARRRLAGVLQPAQRFNGDADTSAGALEAALWELAQVPGAGADASGYKGRLEQVVKGLTSSGSDDGSLAQRVCCGKMDAKVLVAMSAEEFAAEAVRGAARRLKGDDGTDRKSHVSGRLSVDAPLDDRVH